MYHTRFSFIVLATLALLVGCAGGRDTPRLPPATDLGPGHDSGPSGDLGSPTDMFVPPTDLGPIDLGPIDLGHVDMGRRCVTGCTSDAVCQASCPANPTPTNPVCCDRASGTCFNSATTMCPSTTTTDGGTPVSM